MPTPPRARILSAAVGLFSRNGVHVSVDRIIAEADVAPRTLYRHFRGKDELVAEALERWSTLWLQWLSARLEGCGDDPAARFAALLNALEEWFTNEGYAGSFVGNAATELRSRPDHPAHRVISKHRTAVRRLLEELTTLAGVRNPAGLAEELQMLIDGAAAAAIADRRLDTARFRVLVDAALRAQHASPQPADRVKSDPEQPAPSIPKLGPMCQTSC